MQQQQQQNNNNSNRVKSLEIHFSNNDSCSTFSPGQLIRGKIELELTPALVGSNEPTSIEQPPSTSQHNNNNRRRRQIIKTKPLVEQITLRLEGYGKTQWRATGNYIYRLKETLTNQQRTFAINTSEMTPGRHCYPFEFELPDE